MFFSIQIFPFIKFPGYSGLLVMAMTMLKRYLRKILFIPSQYCQFYPNMLIIARKTIKLNSKTPFSTKPLAYRMQMNLIDNFFMLVLFFIYFLANMTQYRTEKFIKMTKLPISQYLWRMRQKLYLVIKLSCQSYLVHIPFRYSWKSGTIC